jgi:hypothetical protein
VSTAGFASRLTSLFSGEQARTDIDAASYLSDTSQWRGLLSVRSPWNTGRVVVIATGTDDHQLQQLPGDMTKPTFKSNANGDFVATGDAGDVRSWRVGEQFTRRLPGYLMILWFASQHFLAVASRVPDCRDCQPHVVPHVEATRSATPAG